MGFDPDPGTPVSMLPFATQEARDRMIEFVSDEPEDEEKGGIEDFTMHLRPVGQLCDVLLSMTLVTKTELGDLVLVGQEMDPKLAGLIGSAAPGNDGTISDITSVTYEETASTSLLSEGSGSVVME